MGCKGLTTGTSAVYAPWLHQPGVTPVPSTVFPMVGPVLEFTVGRSAGPSLISLVVSVDVKRHVYWSAAHSAVRAALRPRRRGVTLKEREIAGRASDRVQVERVDYVAERTHCGNRTKRDHSSGAVWEWGWQSWAVRPNQPSGFRGRKAILNHASALVSACP